MIQITGLLYMAALFTSERKRSDTLPLAGSGDRIADPV